MITNVARDMDRELAAFDAACHEALVAARADAAEQTVADALALAPGDDAAALVRGILRALDEAGLDGVYRVVGMRETSALLWMTSGVGGPKLRSTALRDEGVAALEAAGFEVARVGSWDLSVKARRM